MPTMLTTPSAAPTPSPAEYDFLASFERACTSVGLSYALVFDSYFVRGYVFKGPDYLMLGAPDPTRPSTWHVQWAEFHPRLRPLEAVGRLVRLMPYRMDYVGWSRELKRGGSRPRYYLTQRILDLTAGVPTASHAISLL